MTRSRALDDRLVVACAWGGPVTLVVAFVGWLVAGVLPVPLGPGSSTAEVVAFYTDDHTRVVAGLTLATLGLAGVFPLVAAIAVLMLRIEGRTPILTLVQLATGAATGLLLILPMLLMTIIGFRPERDPGITVAMNDVAWLLFITPIAPFIVQNLAIALAVLTDRQGALPRWVGYANLWIACSFLPDVLAFFFHSGVFGWSGLFVFWLALAAYSVWLLVMPVAVIRAVREAGAEAQTRAGGVAKV